MSDERDAVMTVRLNRDEKKMVAALAEADGVSASDAVRMALRRVHAERFGASKPSKGRR
jgi:hypothetical protein